MWTLQLQDGTVIDEIADFIDRNDTPVEWCMVLSVWFSGNATPRVMLSC
jgi:hypothetical protein